MKNASRGQFTRHLRYVARVKPRAIKIPSLADLAGRNICFRPDSLDRGKNSDEKTVMAVIPGQPERKIACDLLEPTSKFATSYFGILNLS